MPAVNVLRVATVAAVAALPTALVTFAITVITTR